MSRKKAAAALLTAALGLGAALALAPGNDAQVQASLAEAETLGKRAEALFSQGKYAEALAVAELWAKRAEEAEAASGRPGPATAKALNGVCWWGLFAGRYERALEAAERAEALAPEDLGIQLNKAHALIFLGRKQEALAIYAAHKGEMSPGQRKWEDVVAQDFTDFRIRGLFHPAMARAKDALAAAPESPKASFRQGGSAYERQQVWRGAPPSPEAP